MAIRLTVYFPFAFAEEEIPLEVVADYTPERPAPPCSNPDSPAFSDCGDPSEWTVQSVRMVTRVGSCPLYDIWKNNDRFDETLGEFLDSAYANLGSEMPH